MRVLVAVLTIAIAGVLGYLVLGAEIPANDMTPASSEGQSAKGPALAGAAADRRAGDNHRSTEAGSSGPSSPVEAASNKQQEQFTHQILGATSGPQLADVLARMVADNPGAAFAAIRSALQRWIGNRLFGRMVSLFPGVLDVLTRDSTHAAALARLTLDICATEQKSRDAGTAAGVTFMGSSMIQWQGSAVDARRATWTEALLSLPIPTEPGAAMLMAMSLGGTRVASREAIDRLAALHDGATTHEVARTALVNIGNVAGLSDLERLSRISAKATPASREEALDSVAYFSAVVNSVNRHPEDAQRAGNLFAQGLRAVERGVDADLTTQALLGFLVETPLPGTRAALERIAGGAGGVSALAKRALERLKARSR